MFLVLFVALLIQPCDSVGGKDTPPPVDSTVATTLATKSTSSPSPSDNEIGPDLNCTVNSSGIVVYSERATGCFNYWDDLRCKTEYGDGEGVQAGEHNKRPVKCFQDSKGLFNLTVKSAAKAQCARYCGYCCELPEYNCENNPKTRVDCGSFTKQDCFNSTQKPILIENCPNVCGFCNLPPCKDLPDCPYWNKNSNYCNSTDYTYAEKKRDCPLTCNLC